MALIRAQRASITPRAQAINDEALQIRAERAAEARTTPASPLPPPRSAQRTFHSLREACWPAEALARLRCERVFLQAQAPIIQERYQRSRVQRWIGDPASNLNSHFFVAE